MSERAGREPNDEPTTLPALWRRVHEHRIAQWTVGYIAVAYGIQHAVTLTAEAYEWPNIVARVTMTLLALGLPLAMVLAWYHGERASRHVSGGEMAILTVMLAGLSLAFYLFIRPVSEAAPARFAPVVDPSKNGTSIAVLPFLNLSGDPNEDFFSDGMTEEITSALAKIPSLRVVGRTSAFQFKGKAEDLRAIGQALSATHIIEGSVRKDGDEVRITAQLIRADDGSHIWTDSYDRELKGVFAVQEQIAQAIAAALRVPLGLKQGQTLVTNRNIESEGYQKFLRARQLMNAVRSRPATAEAISLLNQVLVRNSDYAPAWAWLANAYDLTVGRDVHALSGAPDETRRGVEQSFAIEEAAAQRALELDPDLPIAIWSTGLLQVRRGNWLAAEELYQKALARDPDDPQVLQYYSSLLAGVGRLKEALAMKRKAQTVEPLVPLYNWMTSRVLWISGNPDEALALAKSLPDDTYDRAAVLGEIYASLGRYGDAADAVTATPPDGYLPGVVETAAQLLRVAPKPAASPDKLPRLGLLGFAYLYAGAPERALEYFEVQAQAGDLIPIRFSEVWHPSYAPVRKTERFKKFVRDAGLVTYWRAKGWPEFCHPTTGDDFACE